MYLVKLYIGMVDLNFKLFVESSGNGDLRKTLGKIPSGHRSLLRGFKFDYTSKNTLNGDKKHIGFVHRKVITVAAPWNYSREFTTLHEIAHVVWEKKLTDELREEWSRLVRSTRKKPKDGVEELFCMSYAQYYAKNKMQKFDIPSWQKFIAEKVPG